VTENKRTKDPIKLIDDLTLRIQELMEKNHELAKLLVIEKAKNQQSNEAEEQKYLGVV
jgi:hypothetical protein